MGDLYLLEGGIVVDTLFRTNGVLRDESLRVGTILQNNM